MTTCAGADVEQPGAYLMPQFTGTKDFRSYMRILWRWKFVLLAFLIAAPLAAYLLERGKPNIYQSSALVGVNSETVNTSVLGNTGSFSTTNVTAIAQLVTTRPVARDAASRMRPPANPAQIVGEVSASANQIHGLHHYHGDRPKPGPCRADRQCFRAGDHQQPEIRRHQHS